MKTKLFGYIFFCACCSLKVQAQTNNLTRIENELLVSFKKITKWRFSGAEGYYDSVERVNKEFTFKLRELVKKHPATISYPFDKLANERLIITTSPDRNLRIYSWDTWTGGTMRIFDNLFQFRDGKRVQTVYFGEDEADANSYFDTIFQAKIGNELIYLCRDHTIGSTRDKGGNIKLFKIAGGKLEKANIIKTTSGLHHSISIYFDMVLTDPENDWPTFKFDAATNTIFVPLIYEDGKPSGKFIRYRFDGKYFQKVK